MILCAACDKPVDAWKYWRDEAKQKIMIRVECHGEVDNCEIDDYDLMHVVGNAVAFRQKKLEAI